MASVKGINRLLLFRIEGETGAAFKLAYQNDHSLDESRDMESTSTKDGVSKTPGVYNGSRSLSALYEDVDLAKDRVRELRAKTIIASSPARLEVWDIDKTHIEDGKIRGEYTIERVSSISQSAPTESDVSVDISTEIELGPVFGDVNVTPELEAMFKTLTESLEFVQPSAKV